MLLSSKCILMWLCTIQETPMWLHTFSSLIIYFGKKKTDGGGTYSKYQVWSMNTLSQFCIDYIFLVAMRMCTHWMGMKHCLLHSIEYVGKYIAIKILRMTTNYKWKVHSRRRLNNYYFFKMYVYFSIFHGQFLIKSLILI